MFRLSWRNKSPISEFKNIPLSFLLPYSPRSIKLKQYRASQIANSTKLKDLLKLCHKEPECLGCLIAICLSSIAPKQCGIFQISSKSLITFSQSCGVVGVFTKSANDSHIASHTSSIIPFTKSADDSHIASHTSSIIPFTKSADDSHIASHTSSIIPFIVDFSISY